MASDVHRLAGDVAAKAVSLLNDFHSQAFVPGYSHDDDTKCCLACHAPGSDFSGGDFTMGKMSCVQCHEPHAVTKVGDAGRMPETIAITGNYPNPFNPATDIQFIIEDTGLVHLEIYNILGQKVRTLLDGTFQEGMHRVTWDGSCDDSSTAGQGMYIVRLAQGSKHAVHRMLMVK